MKAPMNIIGHSKQSLLTTVDKVVGTIAVLRGIGATDIVETMTYAPFINSARISFTIQHK